MTHGVESLRLEAMTREDCGVLASWLTDAYQLLMTAPDWQHPLTTAAVESACFDRANGVEALKVVIGERMVGHMGFYRPRPDVGHLIHVIVDPEVRGKGYGCAMVEAVSRRSFEDEAIRRLTLHVYDTNVSAVTCYLRAGFRVEGHHREATLWNGRTFDTYSMALLRHEWECNSEETDR